MDVVLQNAMTRNECDAIYPVRSTGSTKLLLVLLKWRVLAPNWFYHIGEVSVIPVMLSPDLYRDRLFVNYFAFWCRIHLSWSAGKVDDVTARHTSRWPISVTMATLCQQQDGGSMLLCKRYVNNKMAAVRYYGEVILHLQQYSRRLNL